MRAFFLSLLLLPALAGAHGGLPLSKEIVWRKQTMYLPTQYWGVFVGQEGGPWHWICDEAINGFKLREVFLGGDDTFYATDIAGLSVSRDGGCSWEGVKGEMAKRDVSAIAPDPQKPSRLWVTTVEQGQSVLWRSEDSGRSFQQSFAPAGQAQRGLALSPDGQRLNMTVLRLDQGPDPVPTLYVSVDAGGRFEGRTLLPRPPFLRTVPLSVDPRDAKVVYLLNQGDPTQVLLRTDSDSGMVSELLRLERPIYGVTVDRSRDRLLVATGDGLYYADGKGPLQRSEGLSRAQCASVQAGGVYACSWNYFPDHAAVARSDDGGLSFRRVFQYADTKGVLACPAGTTVAQLCPQLWAQSASLLGIDTGSADMGPPPPPDPGCSCAIGGRGRAIDLAPFLPLGLLVSLRSLRRRRPPG